MLSGAKGDRIWLREASAAEGLLMRRPQQIQLGTVPIGGVGGMPCGEVFEHQVCTSTISSKIAIDWRF